MAVKDSEQTARAPKWHPSASVVEIEQRLKGTYNSTKLSKHRDNQWTLLTATSLRSQKY